MYADTGPSSEAQALLALLKESRGLTQDADPGDTSWYDPARMPDSIRAAERVRQATDKGEKIGIFGDYDCDGVTATAQILRALRRRGSDPVVRLPHRVHDGYGLKPAHTDEFHAQGVSLLITVDTGISAHEAIDRANACGMDVIILDHHHMLTAPAAYAILHPGIAPDFALPHPAAAGVVFSFLHALEDGFWAERDTDLALATMGMIADLVALKGDNRRMVQEGLRAMQRLPAGPLKSFIEQASGGRTLTSTDVAFRLAPRINAAGRMADPMLALKALMNGGELLKDLDTLNSLRQDQTARALERALLELTPGADGTMPPFLSIASTGYPHGILGLLSGKLTERYGRPSMAVHIGEEFCTASLRSPAGYNIVEALTRHSDLLVTYGGHAQAAGCTFLLDQYIALTAALEKDAAARIAPEDRTPVLAIDAELPASAVTQDFCRHLSALEPYGQGNPEPLFLVRNAQLENPKRVGGDQRHLQATLEGCKVIGFGLGELMNHAAGPLDIVCRAGIDTWNGRVTPQLFVVDMRASETQATGHKKQEKKLVS